VQSESKTKPLNLITVQLKEYSKVSSLFAKCAAVCSWAVLSLARASLTLTSERRQAGRL
jgi:hypothetical protein